MKYRYQTIFSKDDPGRKLTELGAQGWRVIHVNNNPNSTWTIVLEYAYEDAAETA